MTREENLIYVLSKRKQNHMLAASQGQSQKDAD